MKDPVPVFRTTPKKSSDGEHGEEEEPDTHDPHFEPIVPLPELVEVREKIGYNTAYAMLETSEN